MQTGQPPIPDDKWTENKDDAPFEEEGASRSDDNHENESDEDYEDQV